MLFSLARRISSLDERAKPVGQIAKILLDLSGFEAGLTKITVNHGDAEM